MALVVRLNKMKIRRILKQIKIWLSQIQGICHQHPIHLALCDHWNDPQLLDHWWLSRLERGAMIFVWFWDSLNTSTSALLRNVTFMSESTPAFQFFWPTAIVQMNTDVSTNATASQVSENFQTELSGLRPFNDKIFSAFRFFSLQV